jgi:hypothetical protein
MEGAAHIRVLPQNLTADNEGRLEHLRQDNQSVDKT